MKIDVLTYNASKTNATDYGYNGSEIGHVSSNMYITDLYISSGPPIPNDQNIATSNVFGELSVQFPDYSKYSIGMGNYAHYKTNMKLLTTQNIITRIMFQTNDNVNQYSSDISIILVGYEAA